jgi:hypothetical protein
MRGSMELFLRLLLFSLLSEYRLFSPSVHLRDISVCLYPQPDFSALPLTCRFELRPQCPPQNRICRSDVVYVIATMTFGLT